MHAVKSTYTHVQLLRAGTVNSFNFFKYGIVLKIDILILISFCTSCYAANVSFKWAQRTHSHISLWTVFLCVLCHCSRVRFFLTPKLSEIRTRSNMFMDHYSLLFLINVSHPRTIINRKTWWMGDMNILFGMEIMSNLQYSKAWMHHTNTTKFCKGKEPKADIPIYKITRDFSRRVL